MTDEESIVLSTYQHETLTALAEGRRPRAVHSVTRRWLRDQGYVTVARGRNGFVLTITELGRQALARATVKPPVIPKGLL